MSATATYSCSDCAISSDTPNRFRMPLASLPRRNALSRVTTGIPHSTACIAVLNRKHRSYEEDVGALQEPEKSGAVLPGM